MLKTRGSLSQNRMIELTNLISLGILHDNTPDTSSLEFHRGTTCAFLSL